MDEAYRLELINTLRSAKLADLLATLPEINQRTFIDAAQLLEEQAGEIVRLNNLVDAYAVRLNNLVNAYGIGSGR